MNGLVFGDIQRFLECFEKDVSMEQLSFDIFHEFTDIEWSENEGQKTEESEGLFLIENHQEAEEFLIKNQPAVIVCCMHSAFLNEAKLLKIIKSIHLHQQVIMLTPDTNEQFMYLANRINCNHLFTYESLPQEYLMFTMRMLVKRQYEMLREKTMVQKSVQWFDMLDFLQHTFYRNTLLEEPWFDENELIRKGRELNLDLSVNYCYVVVILKLHKNKETSDWYKGYGGAEEFVENSRAILGIRNEYHIVEVGNSEVALLIKVDSENECEYIGNTLSLFIDYNMVYYDCCWSAYMSDICSLRSARAEFLKLMNVLEKNVAPQYRLFLMHDVPENRELYIIEGKDWIQTFVSGNTQSIRKEIEDFVEKQIKDDIFSIENLQSIVHRLTMSFYASMEVRKLDVDTILADKDYLKFYAMANKSIEGMYEFFDYITKYNQEIVNNSPSAMNISKNIIRYIRENIDKELTRESIAEQFYMSKGYISNIFKKETGKSLIDYINEEKVNKAKELLVMTPMPVSVVAMEVGFDNFSYFSRLFKKLAGSSPQNYRKNLKQ